MCLCSRAKGASSYTKRPVKTDKKPAFRQSYSRNNEVGSDSDAPEVKPWRIRAGLTIAQGKDYNATASRDAVWKNIESMNRSHHIQMVVIPKANSEWANNSVL
jgi:hypothetical protein